MKRLQNMFTENSATAVSAQSHTTAVEQVKLTKLMDDDIESYLTTFERIMAENEVSHDRWSYQLAPELTGRAQQAYTALPPEEAKTYDLVKEAILSWYDINEETYHQMFRKLRPKDGESPQELITHLKVLATRWARERQSRDVTRFEHKETVAVLLEDARVAAMERQPKDCKEAGRVAGNFLQAHSMSFSRRGRKNGTPVNECPRCMDTGLETV